MPTAAFLTMGCKVNQYDSDAMHETMHRNGYTIVDANEIADVYVVNTCTVTNVADSESPQINSTHHPAKSESQSAGYRLLCRE